MVFLTSSLPSPEPTDHIFLYREKRMFGVTETGLISGISHTSAAYPHLQQPTSNITVQLLSVWPNMKSNTRSYSIRQWLLCVPLQLEICGGSGGHCALPSLPKTKLLPLVSSLLSSGSLVRDFLTFQTHFQVHKPPKMHFHPLELLQHLITLHFLHHEIMALFNTLQF